MSDIGDSDWGSSDSSQLFSDFTGGSEHWVDVLHDYWENQMHW